MAVLLSIASGAVAHHSFQATFDADVTVTVDGVVKDFRFRNPHVLIYLDVSNDDGSVTTWMAEGSSATGWRRAGWKNGSLNPGDRLRVTGNATHDGSPMVSIEEFALLDSTGTTVIANLSNDEDPAVSLGQSKQVASVDDAADVVDSDAELFGNLPAGILNGRALVLNVDERAKHFFTRFFRQRFGHLQFSLSVPI